MDDTATLRTATVGGMLRCMEFGYGGDDVCGAKMTVERCTLHRSNVIRPKLCG